MSAPADRVKFKFKNGVESVINKTVAETLEARKEGTIIKGIPDPTVPFVDPKAEKK